MAGESLQPQECSNTTKKRTWKEGSDEDGFKDLLSERDSILDIPPDDRTVPLMNRYRDIAEKIRRWKELFPHIDTKRPSKAAEKRKAADKARLSTEENRAADRARKTTEIYKAADRARKSTEEYKAADRARKSTEEYKAADRARKSTEEYKAADRARKSTEEYKATDRARKSTEEYKAAAREQRATKKIAEQSKMRPQAPEVHTAFAWEGYGGDNICLSMRPTCILAEPWELSLNVRCHPAPTFTWKKDNKVLGKTIGAGTPLQRNPQLKKKTHQQDDAPLILAKGDSAGTESTEVVSDAKTDPGRMNDYRLQTVTNQTKTQDISNFWQKRRMRCSADWRPVCQLKPETGSATSSLRMDMTKPEDAGNYTVEVTNLQGTIEHSFRIDFTPTLVKDISLREASVDAGGTLNLEAEVSGARVRWYKDGEELRIWKYTGKPRTHDDPWAYVKDSKVSSLKVFNCTVEDSGSYVGRAETEAGQCCTSSCQVKVNEGIKVGIDGRPLSKYEKIRESNIKEQDKEFYEKNGFHLRNRLERLDVSMGKDWPKEGDGDNKEKEV